LPDNVTCPRCGKDNPAGAKFCLECGTALSDAVRPREERKVVSVLFADLVGFTSQAERMDPSVGAVRYIEEAELIASSLKAGAPNAKTTSRR
jgi:hypothetical protein